MLSVVKVHGLLQLFIKQSFLYNKTFYMVIPFSLSTFRATPEGQKNITIMVLGWYPSFFMRVSSAPPAILQEDDESRFSLDCQ